MGDEHSVSRRASLKSIGVMGAAMVLSGTAADARQAAPKPATADKDKKVNVVEVAVDRMAKGHS